MRYAELFAGAGGLSRGLDLAGMECAAHAEIEPHARAVLRRHWPGVRLDGDVSQLNGAEYRGIDLLSGGSPCQDLSVAGKRAGLAGARSGLFHHQARIWAESGATYLLWENVLGALSSNRGADFAVVLSTLVGRTVAVRRAGWTTAGVVAGPAAVAAWRVFDLQHFGPPQRRARVFVLAARTGGVDPAEILALSEGVCGHPAPRDQARQAAAARAVARAQGRGGKGVAGRGEGGVVVWDNELNASTSTHGPLMARAKSGGDRNGVLQCGEVLAFHNTGQGWWNEGETAGTLRTPAGGDSTLANVVVSDAVSISGDIVGTLVDGGRSHGAGDSYDNTPVVCTTGDVTHALTHEGADASEDGTGRGTPIVVGDVAATLCAAFAKKQGLEDQHIRAGAPNFPIIDGRPRRLTPRECERLMGWPDDWTAEGVREDGTTYRLSDTARYRLCGNGVGTPVAQWIAERLVRMEAAA